MQENPFVELSAILPSFWQKNNYLQHFWFIVLFVRFFFINENIYLTFSFPLGPTNSLKSYIDNSPKLSGST